MRKILVWFLIIFPLAGFSQDWNPFLNQGDINPDPLIPAESGGTGTASLRVGNIGSSELDMMGDPANNALKLVIIFSRGVPNVSDPTDQAQAVGAISGSFAHYFTWTYDNGVRTFTGVQNQTIPGFSFNPDDPASIGPIFITYKVVENSPNSDPNNGFSAQLIIPTYASVSNAKNDDFVSSYTWTEDVVLPVKGLELGAVRNGLNVNLNWQTITELNTKQFELERSYNGKQFVPINTQKAAGMSNRKEIYAFIDQNVSAPMVYYRVKLMDIDGKQTLSNIAIVRLNNAVTIKVFPNPILDHFYVTFPEVGKYRLRLLDGNGKAVLVKDLSISTNNNSIVIPRGVLAAGAYQLNILNNGGAIIANTKLIFLQR